ncbi:MAG: cyclic nucleotide-binding domain-containing protein [Bacteroidia bacterium]
MIKHERDYELNLQVLNLCRVFDSLSEEEKSSLAEIGELFYYQKGEKVFDMGDIRNNHFYVVDSGRLLLKLRTKQAKEYEKGELFGEVAIFTEGFRMGSVVAVEDSALLVFDKEKLLNSNFITPEKH